MILKLQTPSWSNNIKKANTAISKNYKKVVPIKRNGKILSAFSDWNNSKLCKFHRFPTCHSFFEYFLLILKKGTVQWLNCTYMKYELNRSYIGGVVVYLLKVRHLDHPYNRHSPRNWVEVKIRSADGAIDLEVGIDFMKVLPDFFWFWCKIILVLAYLSRRVSSGHTTN